LVEKVKQVTGHRRFKRRTNMPGKGVKMRPRSHTLILLSGLTVFVAWLATVSEVRGQAFYEGKTLSIVTYGSVGGGYDTYSRLIARHISKYIPGSPDIIAQNMTGAGGVVATNYLYNRAPRDGTVIGHLPWRIWALKLANYPGARFDFTKMSAVGMAALENAILYTRVDRFADFEAIKRSKTKVKLSGNGRSSTGFVFGRIVEEVVGRKLFNFVLAYPGSREYNLAVRQGEVDGAGLIKSSFIDQLGDMWKAGQLSVFVQTGTSEGKRDPYFPNAPLLSELAETPEGKKTAQSTALLAALGRPFWLPPGVPKERVKILRDAFWNVMRDDNLLIEAKKLRRPIDPARGEKLQKMWDEALAAPPQVVAIVKDLFGTK
jgi:tripartite-type tricarboxylate transporter receptor subunit TctC